MKKLILTVLALLMLSFGVFAADADEMKDDILSFDFTADYSEEKSDMLGVRVKDGFHVSVIKGKLSPISSFGIPLTFVLEDERVADYNYAVFMLKCGYVDEKSVITMRYKTADGSVISTEDIKIADNKFGIYCAELPEGTYGFDIFVNSIEPTQDMYAVDLDYIKLYKNFPVLITIDSTKAYVGSEIKTLDTPALIRDNFTLTPARFVAESVGAKVEWIGEERKVIISKDDITIELVIDNKIAKVNGKEVELDTPPCIINDFTYTPARFVAENLGCNVEWDGENRVVTVSCVETEYVNPKVEEYVNANKEGSEIDDEEMCLTVYAKGNAVVFDCVLKKVAPSDVTGEVAEYAEELLSSYDGLVELMQQECPEVEAIIINYFDNEGNVIISYTYS